MAFIEWNVKLSVGSAVLDQQHKSLIGLINKLHAAMLKGGLKGDMQRIFQELVYYTESHFKAEEGVMQKIKYPRFASHQAQHVEFVRKARDLQAQLQAGKFTVSMDLLHFLKTWLTEHIMVSDQQYARLLHPEQREFAVRG